MNVIKYFGGKGTMYNNIIKHFPNSSEYTTYIEPFGGAYSIGIRYAINVPVEIYNDLDKNVYSLYKVLSTPNLFRQFKKRCDQVYYMADLRLECRNNLPEELSLIDRAFFFYYFNRTSHNGIGGFSVNVAIRRNMSKCISDMLSNIDYLPQLHQRLSKIIVLNQDGIELIKKYSRPGVMIYCDPPYLPATRTSSRYPVDMDTPTHQRFLEACINSQANILISGYDHPIYDVLLENRFTKTKFEVKTTTNNGKPKTKIETLWKNY